MTKYFKTKKIVLKFSNNPFILLKGITSNTLDAPKNAFLDRFGKIIVVFHQIKFYDHVLVIFEKKFLDRLMSHLKRFIVLTHVKVKELDFDVYCTIGKHKTMDDEILIKQKVGSVLLTKNKYLSIYKDEYNKFRLKNKIPIQGIDFDQDMVLNIDKDLVSFKKGCFLGQEIVARVEFKSRPPKKIMVSEICPSKKYSSVALLKGKKQGFCIVKR
jgi:tRNA-modifying protein YgfZ